MGKRTKGEGDCLGEKSANYTRMCMGKHHNDKNITQRLDVRHRREHRNVMTDESGRMTSVFADVNKMSNQLLFI